LALRWRTASAYLRHQGSCEPIRIACVELPEVLSCPFPVSRAAPPCSLLPCANTLLPLPVFAADEPKRGGTLVIGSTQTPRHLNGAVQSGIATAMPSTQIFASPLRFDDKWNPQPYLAESWKLADDGKSLTLKLRKDALFHDGKPVTSADVAFSVMAIKANHPFTTMLGPVEKVETPDATTAIIRMSVPHPAIVLAMSPALCPILPKHIYGDGQDLKNHPRNTTSTSSSCRTGPTSTRSSSTSRPTRRASRSGWSAATSRWCPSPRCPPT